MIIKFIKIKNKDKILQAIGEKKKKQNTGHMKRIKNQNRFKLLNDNTEI